MLHMPCDERGAGALSLETGIQFTCRAGESMRATAVPWSEEGTGKQRCQGECAVITTCISALLWSHSFLFCGQKKRAADGK